MWPDEILSSDGDVVSGRAPDALDYLKLDPALHELHSVLEKECEMKTTKPVEANAVLAMPLTVRISKVNVRLFEKLRRSSNVEEGLVQLRTCYVNKSVHLEGQRQTALTLSLLSAASTNLHYDQLHNALLDEVEDGVDILEKNQRLGKEPSKEKQAGFRWLDQQTSDLMSDWYERHDQHPYPEYEECCVMADSCKISVSQVRKWFANRRQRRAKTRTSTASILPQPIPARLIRRDHFWADDFGHCRQ